MASLNSLVRPIAELLKANSTGKQVRVGEEVQSREENRNGEKNGRAVKVNRNGLLFTSWSEQDNEWCLAFDKTTNME